MTFKIDIYFGYFYGFFMEDLIKKQWFKRI